MNFKNKNITVMGLGTHGGAEGLVRYLAKQGAKILVTDLKDEKELKKTIDNLKDLKNIRYSLGGHKWPDFKNADIVFVNQAVPKSSLWLKKIKKQGIPISSEMNLFFQLCKAKIIGVTGTNGKSTTASLIFEILKQKYFPVFSLDKKEIIDKKNKKVFFGGNIGGSLLKYVDKIDKNDLVLLELSSFQLQDLPQIKMSPHISIILNITPDHLDTHSDFKEYVEAKRNILKFQNSSDFSILNYDSEIIRKISKNTISRILYFSVNSKLNKGAFIENKEIIVIFRGKRYKIMPIKKIKLIGEHNLENVLAAVLVGILYNFKPSEIEGAISKFKGLPHRIEFVKKINGVSFYNDSKSTTPESTIAALKSFKKPLILIAGGKEKDLDFSNLVKMILKKVKVLILIGESAEKIVKSFDKVKAEQEILQNIYNARNIKKAVKIAKKISQKNDIVLFSPACSSFDQFSSFEERGDIFKKLVGEKYDS